MNLEFTALQECSDDCDARIAASAEVIEAMAHCLGDEIGASMCRFKADYESTSGREIQPIHPASADTPRGLLCIATDGERADGRLAWAPGI